jgi:hypothetical protein
MKLAEALALRADLTKQIDSLRNRISRCAQVQEGLKPAENPQFLVDAALAAIGELKILLLRINMTNTHGKIEDGRTLTECVAECDALISQHSLLNDLCHRSAMHPEKSSTGSKPRAFHCRTIRPYCVRDADILLDRRHPKV